MLAAAAEATGGGGGGGGGYVCQARQRNEVHGWVLHLPTC